VVKKHWSAAPVAAALALHAVEAIEQLVHEDDGDPARRPPPHRRMLRHEIELILREQGFLRDPR